MDIKEIVAQFCKTHTRYDLLSKAAKNGEKPLGYILDWLRDNGVSKADRMESAKRLLTVYNRENTLVKEVDMEGLTSIINNIPLGKKLYFAETLDYISGDFESWNEVSVIKDADNIPMFFIRHCSSDGEAFFKEWDVKMTIDDVVDALGMVTSDGADYRYDDTVFVEFTDEDDEIVYM